MNKNPFQPGDFVEYENDCWCVLEIAGQRCFIGDVGYSVSNVIKIWVSWDELSVWVDDDEDYDDVEYGDDGYPLDMDDETKAWLRTNQ